MTLTSDESKALGFVAALLFVSAAVRVAALPEPVPMPAPPIDLAAHIAATERAVADAELMARPLAQGERVDPNAATVPELARLPRVGPALARRIVEDRERHGRFIHAGDLSRIPGIGERMLEQMAPHLDLPARPAAGIGGRPTPAPTPGPTSPPSARGPDLPAVVSLNQADATELALLPGIGPVIADRIITHRDSVGWLSAPEDLLAVRGIGPTTLARILARTALVP